MKKKKISKKKQDEFESTKWNAFIELLAESDLKDLTTIQQPAYLTWRYSSEVLNGGHFQYFENCSDLKQLDVLSALEVVNALKQKKVLQAAIKIFESKLPDDIKDEKMEKVDNDFFESQPAIETELLEMYLNKYENEFIEWTE